MACVACAGYNASEPLPTSVARKAWIEHCPASCLHVIHKQKNLAIAYFFGKAVYRFATHYHGRSSEAAFRNSGSSRGGNLYEFTAALILRPHAVDNDDIRRGTNSCELGPFRRKLSVPFLTETDGDR